MKAVAQPPSNKAAIEDLTGRFLGSYTGDERARRISRRYLPSREAHRRDLGIGARSHVPRLSAAAI